MSIRVTCQCGTSYELKDEYAGRLVKCPQCGRENRVAGTPVAARAQADPVFDRDIFLLRQQVLRISEKYDVGDEKGTKIVFVERPAHLLQNLGALLAAVAVWVGLMALVFLVLPSGTPEAPASDLQAVLVLVLMIVAIVAAAAVGIVLSAKRHVTFYRDATKREKLLDVGLAALYLRPRLLPARAGG
ncbi:MAG: hypothetical protein ACREL9_04040 [Gemmatimonadales bacterium]